MLRRPLSNVLLASLCLLSLAACKDSSAPSGTTATSGTAATSGAADEAKAIFSARCAMCHGQTGAGDGPTSAAMNPRPRSFQNAEWQKSVTDEHIEKVITGGGSAVGKSPLMPAAPDLASKPATLTALREYIRSLGQK